MVIKQTHKSDFKILNIISLLKKTWPFDLNKLMTFVRKIRKSTMFTDQKPCRQKGDRRNVVFQFHIP